MTPDPLDDRYRLTVGDGFRVGFGIFLFQVVAVAAVIAAVAVMGGITLLPGPMGR